MNGETQPTLASYLVSYTGAGTIVGILVGLALSAIGCNGEGSEIANQAQSSGIDYIIDAMNFYGSGGCGAGLVYGACKANNDRSLSDKEYRG